MSNTLPAPPAGGWDAERQRLTEDVLALIEAGVDAEVPDFNGLCLREAVLHYATNKIFREFCDAKKVRPWELTRWQDVPMVYNDVFKTHLVTSFPVENAVLGCLTGGTTSLTQRSGAGASRTTGPRARADLPRVPGIQAGGPLPRQHRQSAAAFGA